MQLVRWNPSRDLWATRNSFGRILDDFFYPTHKGADVTESGWSWNPVVDIYDNDDQFVITAELPGVDKKDISVNLEGRELTLKGERSSDNEVKEENYYIKERRYGKFERVFTLPEDVDQDKITADYKDGVLKVSIPKPEERKPKQVTIH